MSSNGSCNLGSFDLSKFLNNKNEMDWDKLALAVRLGTRFLNAVIYKNTFPTEDIRLWALANSPIGLGGMGYADYLLKREIAYGSQEALDELEAIMSFIYDEAEKESIRLGKELGVPEMCKKLKVPRRNISLLTIAPTGTVSLIAGCSSGIEPIFSEIIVRNDKTGSYTFTTDLLNKPYFRCAVAANGATEVTWEEHVQTLASAQKYVDSGVSKTINFPKGTHRETFAKAVMLGWKLGVKGLAMYRDGSRKTQVLYPKNMQKDLCPICSGELITIGDKKKCLVCKTDNVIEKTATQYD